MLVHQEILYGLLSSDLIGFQTYEYARHFFSTVARILGLKATALGVESTSGHLTSIAICPVGIDTEALAELVRLL